MSTFDEWAKSKKYISFLVIAAGLIGTIATVVAFSSSVFRSLSTVQIKYNAEVEILPMHVMFGSLDSPTLITSHTEHPKSLDEISDWTVDAISKYAAKRGFQTDVKEVYDLAIEGDQLVVARDSHEWKAYMYAIVPWKGLGNSLFVGITDNSILGPMVQSSRALHIFDEYNRKLDLNLYFETTLPIADEFLRTDCHCIFLTFHGSNGQFKGDIVSIYKTPFGEYHFGGNETTRRIDVLGGRARVLIVNDGAENLPKGFLLRTRDGLTRSANLELPRSNAETPDDVEDLFSRIQTMPLGEARERFIDDNSIDLLVTVNVGETKIREFLGF